MKPLRLLQQFACLLWIAFAQPPKDELNPQWTVWYAEDFSTTPLDDATAAPWVLDDYSNPFDTIMDDPGEWYPNDYGPAWYDALNSFATYRKEFPVGDDGWLTASLLARDWNNDGTIESPPSLVSKPLPGGGGGGFVAEMNVPDHTGGVIFRNTRALPAEYRIEYKLQTIDFGGKRNGTIEYDGRVNGYSTDRCKTQHPWGEGSNSAGWSGDASAPYCEWQSVSDGVYGYNGFHFLTIVDFADPAPRNNHFWHYRRKVLMDAFSQHPDRVAARGGGRVCNSNTGEYYDFADSSFNPVNMWISGLPRWSPNPGGLAGNSQWFITTCSKGVAERELSTAAELQPELLLMPDEFYLFAIERNGTGYTLEARGNFARVGRKTLRFHRPFVVDGGDPIWHYNVEPGEYDGRFNNDLVQEDNNGNSVWPDQWPAGSAYPDYFVIGDLYTNVYEGKASLTDIRLYGLAADAPPVTTPPATLPPSSPDAPTPAVTLPTPSPTAPPTTTLLPTSSPVVPPSTTFPATGVPETAGPSMSAAAPVLPPPGSPTTETSTAMPTAEQTQSPTTKASTMETSQSPNDDTPLLESDGFERRAHLLLVGVAAAVMGIGMVVIVP